MSSLQIIRKARGTGKKSRASGIGNVGTTIKCKTMAGQRQGCAAFQGENKNQGKEMKILDTAKITQVARIISLMATLAYMVVLFIGFTIYFIIALIRIYIHQRKPVLVYPHAEKRVIHRFTHNRKHGLFAVIPDDAGNVIREMETLFIIE